MIATLTTDNLIAQLHILSARVYQAAQINV
ncbi:MAG: hypothetical protein QOD32_690 [Pyrinomonadaceae bacterium]|jgi:hypothetical protein|nr:hypothetical protein [Pyrinomonadaceae bacterium]